MACFPRLGANEKNSRTDKRKNVHELDEFSKLSLIEAGILVHKQNVLMSGQVWGHTPEQRAAASTL